jgi:S1-C subfamily serine protease
VRRIQHKIQSLRCEALAELTLAGVLLLPGSSAGQSTLKSSPARPVTKSAHPILATSSIVREINDPSNGRQWLLTRDPAHPGGPGVLIARESVSESARSDEAIVRLHPVIRGGDRVTVEQSSEKVDLLMEGIALAPAALGASLRVRLAMTGKLVPAVALGPGRVVRVRDKEFWP